MTGSVAIDVVLGLVFIYLLYSLLCSILLEFITKWVRLRQRMLVRAISRMLDDSHQLTPYTLPNFFVELIRNVGFLFKQFRGLQPLAAPLPTPLMFCIIVNLIQF